MPISYCANSRRHPHTPERPNVKYSAQSLFHGISPERVAKLRSVTVGGRPLFSEAGEVATAPVKKNDGAEVIFPRKSGPAPRAASTG